MKLFDTVVDATGADVAPIMAAPRRGEQLRSCLDDPDGRTLETREEEEFLVLNGIQTLSARTHQALSSFTELQRLGVDVLRISPQADVTFAVLDLFEQARRSGDTEKLAARLAERVPGETCNGYLLGRAGMDHGHSHAA